MPCYRPLLAWRQPGALGPGERRIVFTKHDQAASGLVVPCGACIGCRLERSRRWAVRIMHEASLHEANSFLTLTYDADHVPLDGSLRKKDFQDFMKRLRRGSSAPLRYFHCGEYGEQGSRPHYHVCLFGEDFRADRVFEKKTRAGNSLFSSPTLSERWGQGHAWIGDLTFESAAYVARYCLKKIRGKDAEAHYGGRVPEYSTSSKRPGIGAGWFLRWRGDTYPSDSVVMRGREMMPPPFYDRLLERVDPELFAQVKAARAAEQVPTWRMSQEEYSESLGSRLRVKECVKEQTVNKCLERDSDG